MNGPTYLQQMLDRMTDEQHAEIDRHEEELAAKRTKRAAAKPSKTYTFGSPTYGWNPQLTIAPRVGADAQRHEPSGATYARFVALANSGDYALEICNEEGVSWQLSRKVVATDADVDPIAEIFADWRSVA